MANRKNSKGIEDRPVRNLIYSRPHRITGEALVKEGEDNSPPQFESDGEKECLRLLAACHDVTNIVSQPFRESYLDSGNKRRVYTPDYSILLNQEAVAIEHKPLQVAVQEKAIAKLIAIGHHFTSSGKKFSILTDDQINIEPRKSNAGILRRFLFSQVSPERQLQIFSQLKDGPKSIRELAFQEEFLDTFRDVVALIARKSLCFNWAARLDFDAQVSLPNQPFKGLHYADIEDSGRFRNLLRELTLGRRPTDPNLLAAARARDWSIPHSSVYGCVGGLPDGAFTGRFRTPGSLVRQGGRQNDSGAASAMCEQVGSAESVGGQECR